MVFWCTHLTQSYTASLSSLLTVQQLHHTVTNVNELIRKGEYVGYQENSFVPGILKHIGFDESKLLVYSSPEERDELFSKGSWKGGIAEERLMKFHIYMKLFLSKYCSKYTMVEPTFKTGGFGFVRSLLYLYLLFSSPSILFMYELVYFLMQLFYVRWVSGLPERFSSCSWCIRISCKCEGNRGCLVRHAHQLSRLQHLGFN